MISVAIIEDTKEYREYLENIIRTSTGFECVGVYGNAETALDELEEVLPKIVLTDIGLPGMTGTECAARLKKRMPGVQVLMFTIFEDADRIFAALKAGATGYLLKTASPERILAALEDLVEGGAPMTPQVARKVVAAFQPNPILQQLTKRELEILNLLSKGYTYKEIAEEAIISVKTVAKHIFNIYEKLHVNSATEAVAKFLGNDARSENLVKK
jgi:DNA-binding NarL/FixJ family response regulator